jgi:hypothetical protein
MANARDVNIDIIGKDKTDRATRSAARNFDQLRRKLKDTDNDGKKLEKRMESIRKVMTNAGMAVVKAVSAVTTIAGAGIPAVIGLAKGYVLASKAAVAVGHAVATMAPAIAAIAPLAASAGFAFLTLKGDFLSISESISPITDAFTKAQNKAGDLAQKGIGPLARAFVRANFGVVKRDMNDIARTLNDSARFALRWAATAPAHRAISVITHSTAQAFKGLAPAITGVAISLGLMIGRIGNPVISRFSGLMQTILNKTNAWLDSITAAKVNAAINEMVHIGQQMKIAYDNVKQGLKKVQEIAQWIIDHQGQLKQIATGIQLTALATSLATANWAGAVVAAFSLVVSNWSTVKATFNQAKGWWTGVWNSMANDPTVQRIVQVVRDTWNDVVNIFTAFWPILKQQWNEATREWKQAWHEWAPVVRAAAPLIRVAIDIIVVALLTVASACLQFAKAAAIATRAVAIAFKLAATILGLTISTMLQSLAWLMDGFGNLLGAIPGADRLAQPFHAAANAMRGAASTVIQKVAEINAATDRIQSRDVSVNVAVNYRVTGDPRGMPTPRGKNIPFSADAGSWSAVDGAGMGRTQAANVSNTVSVDSRVFIDGSLLDSRTKTFIVDESKRQAYRARVGRR